MRSHVPKTIDSPSILYMTGSAVGPYRLGETSRPLPSSGSSAMHSASPSRSSMRGGLPPPSGEAAPRGELRSASSSGIVPTLAVCLAMVGGRGGLPLDDLRAYNDLARRPHRPAEWPGSAYRAQSRVAA